MQKLFTTTLLLITVICNAQNVAINNDGTTANTSAILDVKSTNKGVLFPRVTKTQKNTIATPATGLLVFQTAPDSIGFHYYDGTKWLWLDAENDKYWAASGNNILNKNSGRIGINESTPNAKVHITKDKPSGGVYNSNASVIIEDSATNYLQFSNAPKTEAGVISGNGITSIRSGVIFRSDSSLGLFAGGNVQKIGIAKTGNVALGNFTASVKLDVNGAVSFNDFVTIVGIANTTLSVGNNSTYFKLSSSGTPANRKLSLSDGLSAGQLLIIQCTFTGFRIEDSDANIDIAGTVINMTANDTITFIWDGDEWVELNRSVNQ